MNIMFKSKGAKLNLFPERFNAEDITTIGENLYEIKLTIDPVTEVREDRRNTFEEVHFLFSDGC